MYRRTPILFRIVDSFFRHQLLFWGALLVVSGLTMSVLYARSKTYHAVAMTQVQTQSVANILGQGDGNTWVTPAQRSVDQFNDLVKQNQQGGFLASALRKAQLAAPINVDPQGDDPRYAALQKNLVAAVESPNQFSLSLTWNNPDECKRILDALQGQYIEEVGADKSLASNTSVRFLDTQLADYARRMRISEKALADFKASYGGQLSDAGTSYSNQLNSLQAQLTDKEVTLGASQHKKAFLQQQLQTIKPMSIAEQTVSDQTPLEKEVATLLAKRDAEMAGGSSHGPLTPKHPIIVTIDEQIKALQKQQREAAAPENKHNTQTKLAENPQYQALQQQIAEASIAAEADQQLMQNLRQQIGKYQTIVNQIPKAQSQLTDKIREYSDLQDAYQTYEKQRREVKTKADIDRLTSTSSLLPIGVTYALPTTGRTKLIGMLIGSLILGMLLGFILVVLSEWADHSLRYEVDAERLLGVPVLASLPDAADLRSASSRRALTHAAARPGPEG